VASIPYMKCRGILRPVAAPVIEAGGRNVRVARPFLHLGDVGHVGKRVGWGVLFIVPKIKGPK
jgi:hypothetical protein